MAVDLKTLVTRRGIFKSQLTKFHTFLDDLRTDKSRLDELQVRLDKLEVVWSGFSDIQTQIELIDTTESQYLERDEFEDKYYKLIASSKKYLQLNQPRQVAPTVAGVHKDIVLPQISLPEFSGSYEKWYAFYDTFNTLIHNNVNLNNIQKYQYLQAALKGEAAHVIQALEVSEANYLTAWELLRKRYENKKVIIKAHLRGIFDLPNINSSSAAIRQFTDNFEKHFRALKNLQLPVSSWSTMLIYLLSNKLDPNSKKEWEVKTNDVDLPTIEQFIDFLTKRCRLLESLENKQSNSNIKKVEVKSYAHASTHSVCPMCKDSHKIFYCKKFLNLPNSERLVEIKKHKLCINCFKSGHMVYDCEARNCKKCDKKHNSLLHVENSSSLNENKNNVQSNTGLATNNDTLQGQAIAQSSTFANHCKQASNSVVLLSTALIYIFDIENKPVQCRCLLDSGSQSNFLSNELFQNLKLQASKINLPVIGINAAITNISKQVSTNIASCQSNYKAKLNFFVLQKITDTIPQVSFSTDSLNIPPNIKLADPGFHEASKIDILLGAGVFYELLKAGQIKLGKGQPILQNSQFGWIISGPVSTSLMYNSQCNLVTNHADIQMQLEKFWLVEQGPICKQYTKEELECEQNFVDTFKRDKLTGRFSVNLPLRDNYKQLGESKDIAINRFHSIERKLSKDSNLRSQYCAFMEEYKMLGHMSKLNSDEYKSDVHFYLPHHGVINASSITTKLRVVFDGSSKSSSGISLNDVLKVGPSIQDELFSILVRFRKHNIVLIADIAKMYRQVNITEEHRSLQCIVWRSDPSEPLDHYQLNTITYGTSSASFLSTRCLKQLALENQSKYPNEAQIILHDFYVDDLITGASNIESAKTLIQNLDTILKGACFELRKWASNNTSVFSEIIKESNSQNYIISSEQSCKTLGIIWDANQDSFKFIANVISNSQCQTTKRQILSVVAQIFDPLGLLGPVIVKAKFILQQLWLHKLDWDDPVPDDLLKLWQEFTNDFSLINQMSVPRQILVHNPTIIECHAFSDASQIAYGACVYLKSISNSNNVLVRLIAAKSRIAPIKTLSIPRLELCGAVLMVHLVEKIITSLNLDINQVFYYTDSTIVLSWLKLEPIKLKSFVAHRISEMQELTNSSQWFHVSSDENPADVLSRGVTPSQLLDFSLWWHGPLWLQSISDSTNNTSINEQNPILSDISELKSSTMTSTCGNIFKSDMFDYFSSFTKLIRITAYCLRFRDKLRKIHVSSDKLTISELNESTLKLVKLVQAESFITEIKAIRNANSVSPSSNLASLNPFIDDEGVLRVGGRLRHSLLSYNHKFPIILPSNHKFTKLIIEYEHRKNFHSGIQATLSSIRLKYWPIHGKQGVRNVIRKCVTCFKAKPYPITQKMGDLPPQRVIPTRPFSKCGIDYAGPFLVRDGKLRNRKCVKGYICLFICFVSKAVHLELVSDLSTNSFLNALKRFVSRRGLCNQIFSDNATNFRGADNELKRLAMLPAEASVHNYLIENQIEWNFIPARSPHHGGLWESAIKTAKYYLKRISHTANLTYEEFLTLLCQVEAIMNSRPLFPLSSDPNDLESLTPGHFLIGSAMNAIPTEGYLEEKATLLSRYQYVQRLSEQFWKSWSRDYLHTLQQRTKWKFAKNVPTLIGALVLLMEDHLPPQKWLLGRIISIHPGKDEIVRVVSVRTQSGVFKRSVAKICVLPID